MSEYQGISDIKEPSAGFGPAVQEKQILIML